MTPIIAVHVGAGFHNQTNDTAYTALMNEACLLGKRLLDSHTPALKVIEHVIRRLEAHPLTNTGRGSNLTLNGEVECDASIMSSGSVYGACGAVKSAMYPISIASRIAERGKERCSLGRVPALLIVGNEGAKEFTCEDDMGCCETTEQKIKYKEYIALLRSTKERKRLRYDDDHVQDTVGALVVDNDGVMASGVSSGGIWLKHPGRIGHAGHYGSGSLFHNLNDTKGIWATSKSAICCTGTGETIMASLFASRLSQCKSPEQMKELVLNACVGIPDIGYIPIIGFIAILYDGFWYGFNSESMGIGYMSMKDVKPHSCIHRRKPNTSVVIQGVQIQ